MQARTLLSTHRDPAIAAALTVAMMVELMLKDGTNLATAIPATLLACLPLAARRTYPVAAFVLTWLGLMLLKAVVPAFDEVSVVFVITFFLSFYSLGAYAVGREQPISVVLAILGVGYFVATDGDPFQVGDVVFALFLVGGPWAAGLVIRLRQQRVQELRAENARIQQEQEEQTRRAVAAERSTIARELHDVVSHAISVTVLQARGARRMLGTDDEAVRGALDAIEQTNTAALSDMRRLLAVLRDTEPDGTSETHDHAPPPSLAHLDRLLEHVRSSGLDVVLTTSGEPTGLPPGVDLSAYRIVQEALTNVLKHAQAGRATVRLDYHDDDLEVKVVDDGIGATGGREALTGHGLVGIQERVAVVGGRVDAGPAPDGGFVITARLPYSLEES